MMAGVSKAAQVEVVDGSARSRTLNAVTRDGSVEVQARELRTSMSTEAGSKLIDVLMVYEPQSGLSWWTYRATSDHDPTDTTEYFSAASKIFVGDGKIVVFSFYNPTLWVRQSADHHASLDQVQAAALDALSRLGEAAIDGSAHPFREVDLQDSLKANFFHRRNTPSSRPGAKLSSISQQDKQWRVVLAGPNGDQATVVLDDQYSFVSVEGPTAAAGS